LTVAVHNLSAPYVNAVGQIVIGQFDENGFRVVFDVDEPSPFTFHHDAPDITGVLRTVTLAPQGGNAVSLPSSGDTSGVLAPGHYTFTGTMNGGVLVFPGRTGSGTAPLGDLRLNVAPEPAALAPLALFGGLLLRLPRRRTR
jgi:hypothetical protein